MFLVSEANKSMGKYLITIYKNKRVLALMDNDRLVQASFMSLVHDKGLGVGGIVRGRIAQKQVQLQAFFVQVSPSDVVYLPFSNVLGELSAYKEGDEISVQIIKEAIKSKKAVATMDLSISGKYCVVHDKQGAVNYSHKLGARTLSALKKTVGTSLSELGRVITVRTNAGGAEPKLIIEEARRLSSQLDGICSVMDSRKIYTALYSGGSEYVRALRDTYDHLYDEILTDDEEVYKELLQSREEGLITQAVTHYSGKNKVMSLLNAYKLGEKLDQAFSKQVYLPCGGNIVIEYTEAMTVIDVNTGKCETRKDKEELICLVNSQGASEIMHQLRLRNLSGMILVDFINMEDAHHQAELLIQLRNLAKEDPVHVSIIDMTPLGIVEITRTKVNKSLKQEFDEA